MTDHNHAALRLEPEDTEEPRAVLSPAGQQRPKKLLPSDARENLIRVFALEGRLAREQHGLSQGDVAADLDIQKSLIGRAECSNAQALSIAVVSAAAHGRVSRGYGLRLLRRAAAEYDADVTERPRDVHGDDHGARLAAVAVELTDLPRELAAAWADRQLSVSELERLVREAREARDAADEALARYSSMLERARAGGR